MLLSILAPYAKAQTVITACPFPVTNNLSCNINVTFLSWHGNGPAVLCPNSPAAPTTITPGSTVNFPCGIPASCTATPVTARVKINSIGPNTINIFVDGNNANPNVQDSSTGTTTATWTATGMTIP